MINRHAEVQTLYRGQLNLPVVIATPLMSFPPRVTRV